MTDRLTQLQVCLDQLVAQFNATINYVNTNSEPALLDADGKSYFSIAANAPLPGQQQQNINGAPSSSVPPQADGSDPASTKQSPDSAGGAGGAGGRMAEDNAVAFNNTINELSTDIILKSRQLRMLIDYLPGIGVSPTNQLKLIEELASELEEVEKDRLKSIEEKDKLLDWCEDLIMEVANGISSTR
ncbi:mediator of RNA polymerase II transcription subunit 21 [[Candida] railenensis]|uniref:Mediator of RNA polymerase II transcription subunit 21 n=1 Tax=[Candida] railenensis TaxID=45579 RepID=A0A9P0QVY5_9ASCO|nr:mediator of RNA polymerase II transcription subunit 21 [[Candida] railenensis]